jgi:hypothetical protein
VGRSLKYSEIAVHQNLYYYRPQNYCSYFFLRFLHSVVAGGVADVSELHSAPISMVEVCRLGKYNGDFCLAWARRNSGQTALLRTQKCIKTVLYIYTQKLTDPHISILKNETACIFELSATHHPRTE